MNLAKGIALPREMPAMSAITHSTSSTRRPAEPLAEGFGQAVDELGGATAARMELPGGCAAPASADAETASKQKATAGGRSGRRSRAPTSGKPTASNGGDPHLGVVGAAPSTSTQAPSRSAKASSVRADGSTSQRCADAGVAVDLALVGQVEPPRPRAQHLADPVRRHARSPRLVSGKLGIRSRRQPARSGTSTSSPKCSSGSSMIHQPPGPPRPRSNGPADLDAEHRRAAARAGNAGRGCRCSAPRISSATICSGASSTS